MAMDKELSNFNRRIPGVYVFMERVTIGQITGARGIKGELKVFPLTDFLERFKSLKRVTLSRPMGKANPEPVFEGVKVEGCKESGRFVTLSLDGVNTREDAEKLRNLYVQVPRDEAYPLPEGSFYISDIMGMKVLSLTGECLGEISDIFETGSNDVYVVDGHGKQYLIPAIKEVVKSIDIESNTMIIEPLPGLLD
jgi:16S rRNA processing protein RimM